jgi:hypothetical protein
VEQKELTYIVEHAKVGKDGNRYTLPEGEKDHRLHAQELGHCSVEREKGGKEWLVSVD